MLGVGEKRLLTNLSTTTKLTELHSRPNLQCCCPGMLNPWIMAGGLRVMAKATPSVGMWLNEQGRCGFAVTGRIGEETAQEN